MQIHYKHILEMMSVYEFELWINDNGTLSVRDLQGANLGNIESDEFKDFKELLERFDTYHGDYLVPYIEEMTGIEDYKDWEELIARARDHEKVSACWWEFKMLELVVHGRC